MIPGSSEHSVVRRGPLGPLPVPHSRGALQLQLCDLSLYNHLDTGVFGFLEGDVLDSVAELYTCSRLLLRSRSFPFKSPLAECKRVGTLGALTRRSNGLPVEFHF